MKCPRPGAIGTRPPHSYKTWRAGQPGKKQWPQRGSLRVRTFVGERTLAHGMQPSQTDVTTPRSSEPYFVCFQCRCMVTNQASHFVIPPVDGGATWRSLAPRLSTLPDLQEWMGSRSNRDVLLASSETLQNLLNVRTVLCTERLAKEKKRKKKTSDTATGSELQKSADGDTHGGWERRRGGERRSRQRGGGSLIGRAVRVSGNSLDLPLRLALPWTSSSLFRRSVRGSPRRALPFRTRPLYGNVPLGRGGFRLPHRPCHLVQLLGPLHGAVWFPFLKFTSGWSERSTCRLFDSFKHNNEDEKMWAAKAAFTAMLSGCLGVAPRPRDVSPDCAVPVCEKGAGKKGVCAMHPFFTDGGGSPQPWRARHLSLP